MYNTRSSRLEAGERTGPNAFADDPIEAAGSEAMPEVSNHY
jgi:hypothetical protein